MSGFQHDLAGGNGNLVVTSIQSPNFVHGVSGWQISKDGAAEFHDIIIPAGSGGASIYFSSSAPASPNTGDLWYNTAAGLEVSQWNGSAWVPYLIGTGAISNAAITTPLIAAGAVGTSQIASAAITNALLASAAVGTSNIASGAITSTQISSAAAILGSQLSSSAGITGSQVASGTITASNITAGTIVGSLIAANAITTGLIAAGAVTATQIAANTITASQLAAGIVYAGIVNSTTINAATFTGSVFEGTDFILNTAAGLWYSGTPAHGNLAFSIASSGGTDGFTNPYQGGIVSYDSATDYLQITADYINLVKSGLYQGQQLLATGNATTQLSSGLQSNTDISANVIAQSQAAEGTLSTINLSAAITNVLNAFSVAGTSTLVAANMSGQLNFTSAGLGPFLSGESFHSVSLPTSGGFSGNIRVKLLPWNAVWLDVAIQWTNLTNASFNTGALPSSAYYPLAARWYAIGHGGTQTGDNQAVILVNTSGVCSITTPTSSSGGSGTGAQASCSVIYPTN